MSTDPLGDALGHGEAAAPPSSSQPAGAASAAGQQPYTQPQGAAGPSGYQAPSAYEPQQPEAAWPEPEPERSLFERHPEILVGAAAAGGFIFAQVLGRVRGR